MNRFLATFGLLTAVVSPRAEEWRLGNLAVQWADGWKREGVTEMIRFVAPAGEQACVTIEAIDREVPRGAPLGYAKLALPGIAAGHEKVLEELKEENLPSGATLFSIAFHDSVRNYFGVIFVQVSPRGRLAQMAIEGFGDPSGMVARYRPWARTAHWINEPSVPAAESGTPAADTAVAGQADGKARVVPKPRKRLGAQPDREIDKSGGNMVVGHVQTIEKQFLNTFQSCVATSYNRLTSRLPDEPTFNVRYDIRMTLNTETNELIDIKIVGNVSERRRLLLLEAISDACKEVICPIELRNKYGKALGFSFDLVANYHAVKR